MYRYITLNFEVLHSILYLNEFSSDPLSFDMLFSISFHQFSVAFDTKWNRMKRRCTYIQKLNRPYADTNVLWCLFYQQIAFNIDRTASPSDLILWHIPNNIQPKHCARCSACYFGQVFSL